MESKTKIETILRNTAFANLFDFDLNENNCHPINLSETNAELAEAKKNNDFDLGQFIFNSIRQNNKLAGIGGYLEPRNIYQMSNVFKNETQNFRNIHLGIDIWTNEGSKVYCPFDGKIHSFYDNNNFGDYGPTIITEHEVSGLKFHLLFGHLSKKSLINLKENSAVQKGFFLCELGDQSENVGWPPHLHFQVILDMENKKGDYAGVCNKSELNHYKSNCPNPNLILKCNLIS